MSVLAALQDPHLDQVPNKLVLPEEIQGRVIDCIEKYTCKSWAISEVLRWLVYRVWNAVKAICGISDWQKTKKSIIPSMKKVAEPFLDRIPLMRVQGQALNDSGKDVDTYREDLLAEFDARLTSVAESALNVLVDIRSEEGFDRGMIMTLLNWRAVATLYDFKNEVKCCHLSADQDDDTAQAIRGVTEEDRALQGVLAHLQARHLLPGYAQLV